MATTRRYAETTKVEPERSIEEIRTYAERRDATNFTYAMGNVGGQLRFVIGGRWVQFTVDRPDDDQEWRRRWRVVLLKVKTAFEVYGDGEDTTVDESFMPYLMLPDGTTVGERVAQQMDDVYAGELGSGDLFTHRPALTAPGSA